MAVESSRRTANQLLSAGLRQMDPAIGSAGRKRNPSQGRLPLGQSVVRILDREGELPRTRRLRRREEMPVECDTHWLPDGLGLDEDSTQERFVHAGRCGDGDGHRG